MTSNRLDDGEPLPGTGSRPANTTSRHAPDRSASTRAVPAPNSEAGAKVADARLAGGLAGAGGAAVVTGGEEHVAGVAFSSDGLAALDLIDGLTTVVVAFCRGRCQTIMARSSASE